jgi:PEP-CTERM motif-containing protein
MDMMKLRGVVLAMALLLPSAALADPITSGVWTNVRTPLLDQQTGAVVTPFWGGLSWDCQVCGVGYLINAYGNEQMEYLNNGFGAATAFRFAPDDPITTPTFFAGITMFTNGILSRRADGAFVYNNGAGDIMNSWDNAGQFALFRAVGQGYTSYFLGIEDILVRYTLNDHDHNDYVVTFQQHNVPEPSSLMLMGLAAAGLAARRKLRTA